MSKVCAVVRAVRERSLKDCISSLERLDIDYVVIKDKSTLEEKAKKTIKLGWELENKYNWIMAVDADVIITMTKRRLENYCEEMSNRNWFCFTGYLECTKRGLIDGLHFYNTNYCKKCYNIIEKINFTYNPGRSEYEIVKTLKNRGYNWDVGYKRISFGVHLYHVNRKI